CTDKTGTLTEARIRLEQHVDGDGRPSDRALVLAALNSRFQSGLRSPLDEAIEAAVAARPELAARVQGWTKIDAGPFDFERRRLSVVVRRGDEMPLLVVKGAFEGVLAASTRYEAGPDAGPAPLDDGQRARVAACAAEFGRAGFRLLAVAWREMPPDCR